jgi:hypothetical protein
MGGRGSVYVSPYHVRGYNSRPDGAPRVSKGISSVAFGGHHAFFGSVGSWMSPVA